METHKKKLVIINPSANSGNSQKMIAAVQEILRNESVDYMTTSRPSHAVELASNAESYETVIVIGGDGTVHEVVNGLMTIEPEKRPILALVPSGSGNDSCRMAGIPLDVAEALTTILTGQPKTFDLGLCNGTYFLNSCSVGIDALVVAKTNELKATKKLSGTPLYASALLHVILHNLRSIQVEILFDDSEPSTEDILLCAVTNGQTYGSGIAINPSANPSDGKLSAVLVDKVSVAQTLSYLPALAAKKHEKIKAYHAQDFDHLTLRSTHGGPLVAQRDGEIFTAEKFEFQTIPAGIRILVPQS